MPKWERQEKIVEDDLFRFIDNPTRPTAEAKFEMLEKLGGNQRWYDKWVASREEAANEYFGDNITAGGGDVELMNMAKAKVAETFSELEQLEEKQEVVGAITRMGGIRPYIADRGGPLDFGLSESERFVFDGPGTEMTTMVRRGVDLDVLERPYYSLEVDGSRVAQSALEAGEADLEAVGRGLLPTLSQAGDMFFGVAAGVVGGFAVQGLIDGFVPIVQALQSRGWIHPGGQTQASVASLEYQKEQWLGQFFRLNDALEKYFEETPTYLWVFDDGLTSSPPPTGDAITYDWPKGATKGVPVHHPFKMLYGNSWKAGWNQHMLQGTNLWLRGRVMMLQGRKLGYTTDDQDLLVCMKFGNEDIPSGKAAYGTPMFWVNGDVARMLDDSDKSYRSCLQSNLSSLYFRGLDKGHPWALPDPTDPTIASTPFSGIAGMGSGSTLEAVLGWDPMNEFNVDSSGTSTTVDPSGEFFNPEWGPEESQFVQSKQSEQEANFKYPPMLYPGHDMIRFYDPYWEMLRGSNITMNDWLHVDYLKKLTDDLYLVGGHVKEDTRLPKILAEGDTPDRYMFRMPYNAYLDYRPREFTWDPLFFSIDKTTYGDKIFAESKVGQMLTDVESGAVTRVTGKVINDNGEKALLLRESSGEDVSEIMLQYLRPSTQAETIKWLDEYAKSPKKKEEDAVLEQWRKDHEKKTETTVETTTTTTIPPVVVPKKEFPGPGTSGTDDIERLRLALTEISDLRRRLVALSQEEEVKLSSPPAKRPRTMEDTALEGFLETAKLGVPRKDETFVPILVVGAVVLLVVYNS